MNLDPVAHPAILPWGGIQVDGTPGEGDLARTECYPRSVRRLWLSLILACAACADRAIPLSCPPGTRAIAERCKVTCLGPDDCLAGEQCVAGLCETASGSDASVEDARAPDAAAADAGHNNGADAAAEDAGASCHGLNEAACQASPRCTAHRCPTCDGSQFVLCGEPGEGPPPCAAPQCSCANFGAVECAAHQECVSFNCLSCQGDNRFQSCGDPGTTSPCDPPLCGCDQHRDEQSCTADAVCHPIYVRVCEGDPNMPQCLMRFSRCGNGARTVCDGPVMCRSLPPTCTDGTSVATNGLCYDGCVRAEDCVR